MFSREGNDKFQLDFNENNDTLFKFVSPWVRSMSPIERKKEEKQTLFVTVKLPQILPLHTFPPIALLWAKRWDVVPHSLGCSAYLWRVLSLPCLFSGPCTIATWFQQRCCMSRQDSWFRQLICSAISINYLAISPITEIIKRDE